MKFDDYVADVKALETRNRRQAIQLNILALSMLVALVIIVKLVGSERVVVVPPTIEKTFWVSNEGASNAYLEQMATFAAWLILDVTSESIEWKKRQLLNYTMPQSTGAFKARMEVEATRLKRLNATTDFTVHTVRPNEKTQSVHLTGTLRTHVNGAETTQATKVYFVQFAQRGGRVHITSFEEINNAR